MQNYDLCPTILDLAGVGDGVEQMDGQSAWRLVTGEQEALHPYITTAWGGRVSIRDEGWVYATGWDFEDSNPELYDLSADPDELENVHNQHPDVVGDRRARIEALLGTSIPQPYSQDRFGPHCGHLEQTALCRVLCTSILPRPAGMG